MRGKHIRRKVMYKLYSFKTPPPNTPSCPNSMWMGAGREVGWMGYVWLGPPNASLLHTWLWRPIFISMLFPSEQILTKNCHFNKIHVDKFWRRHFRRKKRLQQRSTTSHRACNVVVLFGIIQDYPGLFRNYLGLFRYYSALFHDCWGLLRYCFVLFGTIWRMPWWIQTFTIMFVRYVWLEPPMPHSTPQPHLLPPSPSLIALYTHRAMQGLG